MGTACSSQPAASTLASFRTMKPAGGEDCAINELLEGRIELEVVLPDGRRVREWAERRTPALDLLVQLAATYRLGPPAGLALHWPGRGKHLPSTPIGALDSSLVHIVRRSSSQHQQQAGQSNPTPPFEPTFRLQVLLPQGQRMVIRAGLREQLGTIRERICSDRGLDASRFVLVSPSRTSRPLEPTMQLADYGSTDLQLVSAAQAAAAQAADPRLLPPDPRRGKKSGILMAMLPWKKAEDGGGGRTKKRPAPPPPAIPEHSRNGSDSSGFHEAPPSVMSDSSVEDPPNANAPTPADALKKRRAPLPPVPNPPSVASSDSADLSSEDLPLPDKGTGEFQRCPWRSSWGSLATLDDIDHSFQQAIDAAEQALDREESNASKDKEEVTTTLEDWCYNIPEPPSPFRTPRRCTMNQSQENGKVVSKKLDIPNGNVTNPQDYALGKAAKTIDKVIKPQDFVNGKVIKPQNYINDKVIKTQDYVTDKVTKPQDYINDKVIKPQHYVNDKVIKPQDYVNGKVIKPQDCVNDRVIKPQDYVNGKVIRPQDYDNDKVFKPQDNVNDKVVQPQDYGNGKVTKPQDYINDKITKTQDLPNGKVIKPQEYVNDKVMKSQDYFKDKETKIRDHTNDKVTKSQQYPDDKSNKQPEYVNEKVIKPQDYVNETITKIQKITPPPKSREECLPKGSISVIINGGSITEDVNKKICVKIEDKTKASAIKRNEIKNDVYHQNGTQVDNLRKWTNTSCINLGSYDSHNHRSDEKMKKHSPSTSSISIQSYYNKVSNKRYSYCEQTNKDAIDRTCSSSTSSRHYRESSKDRPQERKHGKPAGVRIESFLERKASKKHDDNKLYGLEGSVRGIKGQVRMRCADIVAPMSRANSMQMLNTPPAIAPPPKQPVIIKSGRDTIKRTKSEQNINGCSLSVPENTAFAKEQQRLQEEYLKLQQQFLIWQNQLYQNQHLLQKENIMPPIVTLPQVLSKPGDLKESPNISSGKPRSKSIAKVEPWQEKELDLNRRNSITKDEEKDPWVSPSTTRKNPEQSGLLRQSRTKTSFRPPEVRSSSTTRQRKPPEWRSDLMEDLRDELRVATQRVAKSKEAVTRTSGTRLPPLNPLSSTKYLKEICRSSDPREELMIQIRNFGGTKSLKRISNADHPAHQFYNKVC